jgi:hypothetical protein
MAYRSAPKQSSGSILEPYVPYIHRRWAEGCHNALLQLWRRIKKKGYSGQGGRSPQVLKASAPHVGTTNARAARAILPGAKTTFEPPASRRGAWWLLKQREDLSPERRTFVEQLCHLCPEAKRIQEMAQGFRKNRSVGATWSIRSLA